MKKVELSFILNLLKNSVKSNIIWKRRFEEPCNCSKTLKEQFCGSSEFFIYM